MQLPQDLQHFPHLALIVVSDHGRSKLFLVGGESLEELDGVALPAEPLPDHEGSFVPGSNHVDQDRMKHYLTTLAKHVSDMVEKHGVTAVHVVAPAEVSHALIAALPHDVSSKVAKHLELDLMNEAPLDIVRRLLA